MQNRMTEVSTLSMSTPTNGDYITKDNLMATLEQQIIELGYFPFGKRWRMIEGNNSKDLYFKDTVLKGYYRLIKTDQKIRLD